MKKHASAEWQGNLKEGTGHISTESGALDKQPFGFNTRFEDAAGTNPEELIGAAHAGCFAMALSAELGKHGITPESIKAAASVQLEKDGDGFTITRSDIHLSLRLGEADRQTVKQAIETTRTNCPVGKVLNASTEVTVDDY